MYKEINIVDIICDIMNEHNEEIDEDIPDRLRLFDMTRSSCSFISSQKGSDLIASLQKDLFYISEILYVHYMNNPEMLK